MGAVWLQALVNENLDYEDKTERLEAALAAANGKLARRDVTPRKLREGSDEMESSEAPVQLLVRVCDSQRALIVEARIIVLWYYVSQLLVRP